MTKEQVITKEQAKQLKPYLKYMDFGTLRQDRRFLVEKMMYRNMIAGNIKSSILDDLMMNYKIAHPGEAIPEILLGNVQ